MKFLRDILLHNIVIKIVSLILAGLTWIYIAGQLYKEELAKEKEAPSIIKVSGEKLIVKRLPIYVNIEGTAAEGYTVALDKVVIKPSYSVVAGPPDAIKDLSHIATEPINIDGADNTIRKAVKLTKIPNCKIGYEKLVSVTVPIIRQRHR